MQRTAFIALGSNLDNSACTITSAIDAINDISGAVVIAKSSLYCTAPIGFTDQPDFVNAVIAVKTTLSPHELLATLLVLESSFGRVRKTRNGPRTLDLDLLLYDQISLETLELTLPHPRLHLRAFVLVPLAEIAPELKLPGRGSVQAWLPAVATQTIQRIQ